MCIYTMEYYAAERLFCNSMDGTEEYYAKWKKPGGKRQIPYDLTYNRNLMNKTNKCAKQNQTWKQGTDWQWSEAGGGGEGKREGEGSRQGICINDPWTWTIG